MQAVQFVLLPPWGTIKIVDLQREHFSTAKTTPLRVIMSPECPDAIVDPMLRQKSHGATKRTVRYFEFTASQKTHRHTHL